MRYRYIFSVLLLPLLFSCKEKETRMARVWIFDDEWWKGDGAQFYSRYPRPTELGLSTANFIDLQPDGSFHSYLAKYTYGQWHLEKNIITLVDHDQQKLQLKVLGSEDNRIALSDNLKNRLLPFQGMNNQFSSSADNPFHPDNNRWRIKAVHRETATEIDERLKNHFRFWEKYFAWALKSELDLLPIGSIPSLLKMYGNGFSLEYYEYQPAQWKNLFYDSADSYKAYERMYYLMYQKKIKWPETKNRYKGFVSAFGQLQEWF